MLIDTELCSYYIGRDEAFWTAVSTALESALAPEGQAALYQKIEACLLKEQDVKKATALVTEFSKKAAQAGPLVPLGVLASFLEKAIEPYQRQGADDEMLKATFGDVLRWVNWYKRETGRDGLAEICWAVRAYCNKLYQIGCLQYERIESHYPVQVWQMGQSILVLSAGGVYVNHQGRACQDITDASFITGYKQQDNEVSGHLIDTHTGEISPEETAFATTGMTRLLRPGEEVLTMHIPAGTSLDPAEVDQSLAAAKRFFEAAGMPFALCLCHSWMLDPQIEGFVQPGSRILNLARRFARFTVAGEGSGARFIFLTDTPALDLPEAAIKTSLQKAVIRHLKSGGRLYDLGGAMLL